MQFDASPNVFIAVDQSSQKDSSRSACTNETERKRVILKALSKGEMHPLTVPPSKLCHLHISKWKTFGTECKLASLTKQSNSPRSALIATRGDIDIIGVLGELPVTEDRDVRANPLISGFVYAMDEII